MSPNLKPLYEKAIKERDEYAAEVARLTAIITMYEQIGDAALTSAHLAEINSVAKWFNLTENYKALVDKKQAENEHIKVESHSRLDEIGHLKGEVARLTAELKKPEYRSAPENDSDNVIVDQQTQIEQKDAEIARLTTIIDDIREYHRCAFCKNEYKDAICGACGFGQDRFEDKFTGKGEPPDPSDSLDGSPHAESLPHEPYKQMTGEGNLRVVQNDDGSCIVPVCAVEEKPAPQHVTGEMLSARFGDTSHFTDKPAPRTKTSFGTEIGQHHESIVMGIPKNPAPNAPDIHDTPWLFGHQTLGHPDGKAGEPCPCDTCPKEAKCHFDSIAATKRGCAIYAEWDKRRSGAPLKRADDIYDDLDEALREDGRTEERRSG